jgi:hypothetical protein
MDKKVIPPDEWGRFVEEFSERNRGRRARFEAFAEGTVMEEDEEAVFESLSMDGGTVTVRRTIRTHGEKSITDELTDIHGLTVQFDSDGSDNTIEFTDDNGDLAVLHFESMVDGEN